MASQGSHMSKDTSLRNAWQLCIQTYFKSLYSIALVTKLFKNSTKWLYVEIVTEPSLLLNVSLYILPLSFITEALHLVTNIKQ